MFDVSLINSIQLLSLISLIFKDFRFESCYLLIMELNLLTVVGITDITGIPVIFMFASRFLVKFGLLSWGPSGAGS